MAGSQENDIEAIDKTDLKNDEGLALEQDEMTFETS